MRKIEDVLRLHARGLSTRRISLATGVGKTTVIEYLRRATTAGLSWPLPAGLDEAALERLLFPPLPPAKDALTVRKGGALGVRVEAGDDVRVARVELKLDGLRGEDSIAKLCRKEGIAQSLYYTWSKEFMEAGKRRLAGDTARAATTGEVQDLRREARALKECVADLTLENRLLKKSMVADGGNDE